MARKTILVIYTNSFVSDVRKQQKYSFNTYADLQPGDMLTSHQYSTQMQVTDVLEKEFKYYNRTTGDFSNEILGSSYYPVKNLVIGEQDSNTVYATKVNNQ